MGPLAILYLMGECLLFVRTQYVFTQLFDNLYFGPSTKQILLTPNLGDFVATQRYSLWGWHRFEGETPAISNVLGLRNVQLVSGAVGTGARQFPDPQFPPCPVTPEILAATPALLTQPEVAQNPNCFPQQFIGNGDIGGAGVQFQPTTDILYINFDLTSLVDYSFIFLIQTGISSVGSSDMRVLGFTNIPLYKGVWSYFAISCDYQAGVASAYYRAFDGVTQPYQDQLQINYPAFQLTPLVQLVIAGVETNPYFESTSGFIGNIAYVEMALFYSPALELMWMGFLPLTAYSSSGILADLYFDQYQQGGLLSSRGAGGGQFAIVGPHAPVFAADNNLVGVQFGSSASVPLQGLDFNNENDLIRSLSFLFYINYTEPLPDQYFLLQRGTPGVNGFLGISLVRAGEGRAVRVDAFGANGPVSWTSSQILRPNTRYEFITGIALSPNNTAQLLYWDRGGRVESVRLSDYFPFSTAPQQITLLGGNPIDPGYTGSLTFYRFTALNSLSNIIYSYIVSQNTDQVLVDSNRYCTLRTSWYGNDFGCAVCRDSILGYDTHKCLLYCPYGFKNAFNDACLPCLYGDCSEVGSTVWYIYKLNDYEYELRPSRPLLSNIDYTNLFRITIPGLSANDYSYTLTPYPGNQTVVARFNFTRGFENQAINVQMNQDFNNPIFDVNRNILYATNYTTSTSRTFPDTCVLDTGKARSLRGLAITTLVFVLAMFVMLLILSLCCWKRLFDLGGIWKYFLHYWMRFQMVAMFLFLAIYMPCCVRAYLEQLYWIGVSWNKALGRRINEVNRDDPIYQQALINRPSPRQFALYDVYPYMIHNVGVFFIVQAAVFVFYLMMKLWDCFSRNSGRCCYALFTWFEYTLNIVFYGLIAFQAWVFAGLNFRYSTWERSYFTISFVMAIFYVLVFALFWIYAAFRILGPFTYFYNPLNYNKFIYFFVGYRNSYCARSYDLWFWLIHFIIGLMIGVLAEEGLAQLIIILVALVILFLITALIRPFRSVLLYIIDLLSQALIIAAVVLFLVIAIYNNNGCFNCSDLSFEGSLCWAIVMLLFLGLLLPWLGLLGHLLLSLCLGDRYRSWGRQVREVVQTNYINTVQDYGVLSAPEYGVYNTTTLAQPVYTAAAIAQPVYSAAAIAQPVYTDTYTQQHTAFTNPVSIPANTNSKNYYSETYNYQDQANVGQNKSMKEFMQGVRVENNLADDQNMTYISSNSHDLGGGLRAGTLAADEMDEGLKQDTVLSSLTDTYSHNVGSHNVGGGNNYGKTSDFLNDKKRKFYEQTASIGYPASTLDNTSALGEDYSSQISAPIDNRNFTRVQTSTNTIYGADPLRRNFDQVPSSTGYGVSTGLAFDGYTPSRVDNIYDFSRGTTGETFGEKRNTLGGLANDAFNVMRGYDNQRR